MCHVPAAALVAVQSLFRDCSGANTTAGAVVSQPHHGRPPLGRTARLLTGARQT